LTPNLVYRRQSEILCLSCGEVWISSSEVANPDRPARFEPKGIREVDKVYYLSLLLLGSALVIHTLVSRGLYADGAYFMLSEVTQGAFVSHNWARKHTEFATQWPVLLGVLAGVDNLRHLAWLHSFGLFFGPTAFYALSLRAVRADGLLLCGFIITICLIVANTGFFAIGEFHIAFSAGVLIAALLVQPAPLSRGDMALLMLTSLVAIRTYESYLFLGPALIGLCMLRLRAPLTAGRAELHAIRFAVGCLTLACAVSAWSVTHPVHPEALSDATRFASLIDNPQLMLWICFWLIGASTMLGARLPARLHLLGVEIDTSIFYRYARWRDHGALLLAVAVGVLVASFVVRPDQHYSARIPVSLILLSFIVMAALYRWAPARPDQARSLQSILHVTLAAVFLTAAPDAWRTLEWRRFVDHFQQTVDEGGGFIAYGATDLSTSKYTWGWTNPCMSLVLRSHVDAAILLNPDTPQWQPFDPRVSVPDLGGRVWR
jgi:hypothetical protein